MTILANGLNGSNDPNGPAKPNPGPTFPRVVAAAPIASRARHVETCARRLDRQDQRARQEEADVDHTERQDRPQRPLVDDAAVEPDRQDGLPVHRLVELAPQDLRDQEVPHDLDRTARRTGAATDQHHGHEGQRRQHRPVHEVGARVAGRGHHRDDLEDRLADGGLAGGVDVRPQQLEEEDQRRDEDDHDVGAELLVAQRVEALPQNR